MTTGSQHRLQVYTAASGDGAALVNGRYCTPVLAAASCANAVKKISDFAVGFSRQPLPIGNRFAIVTNAGGPGIMATDAATCHGIELAKLRPETLETRKAKLPPTANPFHPVGVVGDAPACTVYAMLDGIGGPVALKVVSPDIVQKTDVGGVLPKISTAEEARAGFKSITNGVKQKLPSARLPGVEVEAMADARIVLADPARTS